MTEPRDEHLPAGRLFPGDGPHPAATHPSPPPPPSQPKTSSPTSYYTGPDSTTDATYLYLTFAAPLPTANTTLRNPSASPPPSPLPHRSPFSPRKPSSTPPPPPDLTPYANPQTWAPSRKYLLLTLSCVATWLTAYTAGSYSPPQHLIQAELSGYPSDEAVLTGITTFCLGFALTPMVLAPLSEMNGRYPVFVASGVVYVVFQAVCGVVTSLAGMLIARFLVGAGASVFSTMVGGVIADMWDAKGRNMPMAVFSGSVLAGTGVGPLVGAVMAQRLAEGGKWKWIFWHQVILGGVLMVALVVLFRESRGSVLLSRKARALNKWYERLEGEGYFGVWEGAGGDEGSLQGMGFSEESGDDVEKKPTAGFRQTTVTLKRIRWLVKEDEERASLGKMIAISVSRPFHLLCTESVVFFFSLWVAFAWGILYLTFGSIPLMYQTVYGWSLEQAGYVFASLIIGAVLATAIGIWQEQVLSHPKWAAGPALELPSNGDTSDDSSNKPVSLTISDHFWAFLRRRFPASAPESRLYFTCLTSTLLPIGLFIFGFASRQDLHWIGPAIGLVCATMGILAIYLAVFNYFADTYGKYASSALAAQSFCRNVLAAVFPLVTGPLFRNLGEARAGGLLGAIATALTVVPWVLVFFGEQIRARSPFANQLEKS